MLSPFRLSSPAPRWWMLDSDTSDDPRNRGAHLSDRCRIPGRARARAREGTTAFAAFRLAGRQTARHGQVRQPVS
jgi:hypothetical protein